MRSQFAKLSIFVLGLTRDLGSSYTKKDFFIYKLAIVTSQVIYYSDFFLSSKSVLLSILYKHPAEFIVGFFSVLGVLEPS